MLYLWLKALHVMAVIAWMAGMLYLPRLFVYHAEAGANAPIAATFKVMERRLYRGIIMPAMIATWVFGLWLVWEGDWLKAGWLHGKLALVLLLTGIHGFLGASLRRFAEDRNSRSPRFWRVMNEAPALLLVGIVILVVVKPF